VRHVGRGTFLADALHPAAVTAPADTSPAEIMAARRLLEPQLAGLAARSPPMPTWSGSKVPAARRGGPGRASFEAWTPLCIGASRWPVTTGCWSPCSTP